MGLTKCAFIITLVALALLPVCICPVEESIRQHILQLICFLLLSKSVDLLPVLLKHFMAIMLALDYGLKMELVVFPSVQHVDTRATFL